MRTLSLAALLAALVASPAFAQEGSPAPAPDPEAAPEAATAPTLVAVLEADGRFSTLLAALEATNLVEYLSGEGPMTVFAPTNEAFAALPEGALEALTPEQLQGVLLYHVIGGAIDSEAAALAGEAPTASGEATLTLTPTEAGGLMVNDASVVEADVAASNGVVHVIDGVLLPPAPADAGTGDAEGDDTL